MELYMLFLPYSSFVSQAVIFCSILPPTGGERREPLSASTDLSLASEDFSCTTDTHVRCLAPEPLWRGAWSNPHLFVFNSTFVWSLSNRSEIWLTVSDVWIFRKMISAVSFWPLITVFCLSFASLGHQNIQLVTEFTRVWTTFTTQPGARTSVQRIWWVTVTAIVHTYCPSLCRNHAGVFNNLTASF